MNCFKRPDGMFARCGLAALGLAGPGALRAQTPDPPAPVFTEVSVHDPAILRADGTFYIYGSHLASASSPDLVRWTQLSTDESPGNLLVPNPAVEFAEVLAWAQTDMFWAPDVIRLGDGRYYLYYDASRGDAPRAALGLAVADSPTGPFKHIAVLLKSGMWGQPSEDGTIYDATVHPNVVDPAVFFDQTGRLWMVYGSYSGGIFILRLDPATGRPLAGQGYGKKLIGGNHARIEGPYILYSPESNYYYLFLSFGGLASNGGYNIRVGRARQPDGPYYDAAGNDLTNVKGAPGTLFDDASIAPYGVKLMGGYQFVPAAGEPAARSPGYLSPGHNSAWIDPATGEYLLVFHTHFVGRGEAYENRVHQMFVNADGWFVVAPHRYAREKISPAVPAQIPGDYKFINHGKAITATVSTSSLVTLSAGGAVAGAASGTWQLSGDYDVTLTLGGAVYRGVFVRQWDNDNQVWVLAFTALSGDGVAVWGSKVAAAEGGAAPVITTQPASRTVTAGAAVTFTVAASGSPAPAFQWQKGGADIPGATGTSYSIASVTAGDAGAYTVVATNAAGSVTSSAATLTVNAAPAPAPAPSGGGGGGGGAPSWCFWTALILLAAGRLGRRSMSEMWQRIAT